MERICTLLGQTFLPFFSAHADCVTPHPATSALTFATKMADILDYGEADEDHSRRDGQDDVEMEVDTKEATERKTGGRGRRSRSANFENKLYPFPAHLGVEAGANRGPETMSEDEGGQGASSGAVPWDQDRE